MWIVDLNGLMSLFMDEKMRDSCLVEICWEKKFNLSLSEFV